MNQPQLPLLLHGDTATCRRCGKTLTHHTDTAQPYWLHPNRYPYCKAPDGTIGPAEPNRP